MESTIRQEEEKKKSVYSSVCTVQILMKTEALALFNFPLFSSGAFSWLYATAIHLLTLPVLTFDAYGTDARCAHPAPLCHA